MRFCWLEVLDSSSGRTASPRGIERNCHTVTLIARLHHTRGPRQPCTYCKHTSTLSKDVVTGVRSVGMGVSVDELAATRDFFFGTGPQSRGAGVTRRPFDFGQMSSARASRGAWAALPFTGPAPKSTFNHSSVLTSKSTLMVMGGETQTSPTPLGDLYLYRARKWAPSKRHNAPTGVSSHSSVAWGAKCMTFGGRTPSGLTNELHSYNEGSHTNTLPPLLVLYPRP